MRQNQRCLRLCRLILFVTLLLPPIRPGPWRHSRGRYLDTELALAGPELSGDGDSVDWLVIDSNIAGFWVVKAGEETDHRGLAAA